MLRNWDLYAQKQIEWHPLEEIATQWCFNASSRLVAAGSDELSVWVAPTGEQLANWNAPSWTTAMALQPRFADCWPPATMTAVVRVWEWHGPTLLQELRPRSSLPGRSAPWLSAGDGERLAAAGEDRLIRIWNVPSGALRGCLTGHTDRIPALAWHPGRPAAGLGRLGHHRPRLGHHHLSSRLSCSIAIPARSWPWRFSPEGRLLACADSASAVHIWDFDNSRTIGVLRDQARECTCLTFSPDGQRLAGGGADRVISVWDARRELEPDLTGRPQLSQTCVAVTPDDQRLYSLGAGTALRIWDIETGANADTQNPQSEMETSDSELQISDRDRPCWTSLSARTASGSRPAWPLPKMRAAALLALYHAGAGQRQRALEGRNDPVTTLAFSSDSRQRHQPAPRAPTSGCGAFPTANRAC